MTEITTLTSKTASITVTREDVADHRGTPRASFIVTGSTGYRAVLPACERDDCAEGRVKPCTTPTGARGQHSVNGKTSVSVWLAHCRTHCHGWHADNARAFAERVLKTYPARRRAA